MKIVIFSIIRYKQRPLSGTSWYVYRYRYVQSVMDAEFSVVWSPRLPKRTRCGDHQCVWVLWANSCCTHFCSGALFFKFTWTPGGFGRPLKSISAGHLWWLGNRGARNNCRHATSVDSQFCTQVIKDHSRKRSLIQKPGDEAADGLAAALMDFFLHFSKYKQASKGYTRKCW